MLQKNIISRLFKLSQVKSHSWFKGFNWDNLVSLNIHPPYKPLLNSKQENKDISFIDYAKNNLTQWKSNEENTMSKKEKLKFEDWFNNF